MSEHVSTIVCPELPQQRRLVTTIPGPRSQALHARKSAAASAAVGTTLPVYTVAAGGGVIVDVDGNSLLDLGSDIGVKTAGNSAPRDGIREFQETQCLSVDLS